MAFDPDAFLAENTNTAVIDKPNTFDPDAFLAENTPKQESFDPDKFIAENDLPTLTGQDIPESYRKMGVKQWKPSSVDDSDYQAYLANQPKPQAVQTDTITGDNFIGFPTKHPKVKNSDGSVSNVILMGGEYNGREYVIPSMVDGKKLSNKEAWDVAFKNGIEKYPSFATIDEANKWAETYHGQIDENGKLIKTIQGKSYSTPAIADPQEMPKQETKPYWETGDYGNQGGEYQPNTYVKKVQTFKQALSQIDPSDQATVLAISKLGNPFNIASWLSKKGITPDGENVSAFHDAVKQYESELKLSDPVKWAGIAGDVGKMTVEFAAVPGAGGIPGTAGKFALQNAMTMPTTEEQQMGTGEYLGRKVLSSLESGATGVGVGVAGKYIPNPLVRTPVLMGAFGGQTYLETGDINQALTSAATVLGFELTNIRSRPKELKALEDNATAQIVKEKGVPEPDARKAVQDALYPQNKLDETKPPVLGQEPVDVSMLNKQTPPDATNPSQTVVDAPEATPEALKGEAAILSQKEAQTPVEATNATGEKQVEDTTIPTKSVVDTTLASKEPQNKQPYEMTKKEFNNDWAGGKWVETQGEVFEARKIAKELGITPEEVYAKYGITFERPNKYSLLQKVGSLDGAIRMLEDTKAIVHKEEILKALSEGKPIPTEVLADYPNLQKQSQSATLPPVDKEAAARDIAPSQTAEAGKQKVSMSPAIQGDFTHWSKLADDPDASPKVRAFLQKLKKHSGNEIISENASGTTWRGTIDTETKQALIDYANLKAQKSLERYPDGSGYGTVASKTILNWLNKLSPAPEKGGEGKPKKYDLLGREVFEPITGKQQDMGIAPPEPVKSNADIIKEGDVPTAKFDAQDIYLKKLVRKPEMFNDPANPLPEINTALNNTLKGESLLGGEKVKPELQKFISDYVSTEPDKNTVFTKDRYEKAKKNIKDSGTLFSGFDPNKFKDIIEIGGYHFEKGLREFTSWSKAMIDEFGEKIKPHLQKIWDKLDSSFDVDRIARKEHLARIEERIANHDLYKEVAQNQSQYLSGGTFIVGKTEAGDVKHFLESHPELKKNIITQEQFEADKSKYPGALPWDTAMQEAGVEGGIDSFLTTLAERTAAAKGNKGKINENHLETALKHGEPRLALDAEIRSWLKADLKLDDVNQNIREMGKAMGMDEADIKAELLEKATEAPKPPRKELKTRAEKQLQKLIEQEYANETKKIEPYRLNINKAVAEIDRLKKVIGDSKELIYEPQRKKIKLLEREVARQQKKVDEIKTKSGEKIAKIRKEINTRVKGRVETVKKNLEIKRQEEQAQLRLRLDRIKEALSQRTTTIIQARNSIKEIMAKLPMEADSRVDEVTDPAEYVKLIEDIKQKVKAKMLREPTAEELDRIDYDKLKHEPTGIGKIASKTGESVQGGVKYYAESLSSRVKVIAPKIAARVRKLLMEKDVSINEDNESIHPWVKGFQKLSKDEKTVLSAALNNGNMGVANRLIDKYDLRDVYNNMLATKEHIRQEAVEAGIDVGQIENHYPRYIKDFKKYQEDYDRFWSNKVKEREKQIGRKLTPDEEAALANRLLSTRQFGISTTPGSAKHREFKFVPEELVKHYTLADEGIDRYVNDMREKIFRAKLLGKEPENIRSVRKQLSSLYTRFAKMADDDPAKLKMGKQIIKIQDWLESKQLDNQDSIGKFAVEAIKKGELNSKDAHELQKAMTALFEPDNPKGSGISNLISMDTLNMLSTSLSQAQGQPAAMARHPGIYAKTITGILKRSIAKAFGSDSPIFRYTLGEVAQKEMTRDLYEGSKWRKAKKTLMFAIAKFDKLDANVDLEQFYNEFQSASKKGKDNADTEYLKKIFDGDEYKQVLNDFKNGNKTSLTKLAIYNRLADVRLLSKFEQSEGFTKAGAGDKLFYKFKTAQIKMVNWYYEESIRNIQSKNPILVKEGYKNLVRIPLAMLAANIAVNTVQDWMKGRKINEKDITIDSALQMLPIVNRYAMGRFMRDGISGFIASMIPTGRSLPALGKAAWTGKPEYLLKAVPWVGDILYNKTDFAKKQAAKYENKGKHLTGGMPTMPKPPKMPTYKR